MNALSMGVLHPVRRRLYRASVGLAIKRANIDVDQAFGSGSNTLGKRVGGLTGLGVGLILAFSFISYAVTAPPENLKVAAASRPPAAGVDDIIAASVAPEMVLPGILAPDSEDFFSGGASAPELPKSSSVVTPDLLNLPKPAMPLPVPSKNSLYLLAVDKTRRELLVLQETKDNYLVVKRFPASLGALRGDKRREGDKKTPEGLYTIAEIKEDRELPPEYGPRAFVLNYPNELDRRLNKTGSGIWIHGSGLGASTKATKGCVEINDMNIVDLGEFADVGTPVYIFPEGFEIPIRNNVIQKHVMAPEVLYGLKEWMASLAATVKPGG